MQSSVANLESDKSTFRKIKSLQYLYEINGDGTILRNVKSKKQLKIFLDFHHSKSGYYTSFCCIKGVVKRLSIHKLVAECFIGECPDGLEVDHIDRNTRNNNWHNLRYVNHSQQMKNRVLSAKVITQAIKNCQTHVADISIKTCVDGKVFASMSKAARYIGSIEMVEPEKVRQKMKSRRKFIFGHDVSYH